MTSRYCTNCGRELLPQAAVCLGCGRLISPAKGQPWSRSTFTGLLVLAALIPPLGYVLGAVGLGKEGKKGQGGWLLVAAAIASFVIGIILGILSFALELVLDAVERRTPLPVH